MSQQEYTIHIFGQDLTSQDGLFRLDEIRVSDSSEPY